MKVLKAAIYILGLTSFFFTVPLFKLYFHAKDILGYFPSYNKPDSGTLKITGAYAPYINAGLLIWGISLIVWFFLSIIFLILTRKNIEIKPVLAGLICHSLGVLAFISGIVEWYLD